MKIHSLKTVILFGIILLLYITPVLAAQDSRAIKRKNNEKRQALVIGNSSYAASPLKNPVNDATDIATALKKRGFKVQLLRNADQRQMENAIQSFGKGLRAGGVGLFYYAGHGIQYSGRNYLIPINARIESESDVKYDAVDAGRVLGKMEDAGNDINIVILDACRNNPFARSFRSAEQGLARMDAPTGSLVAYATAPGSVAADGQGRNGVYTKYLLQYMEQPGLTVNQLFMEVRKSVLKETGKQQTPWESSSLTGNFYFTQGSSIKIDKPDPVSQPGKSTGSLLVRTEPADARIRILNIASRYSIGMELDAGSYNIEVSAKGYVTDKRTVEMLASEDLQVDFALEEVKTTARQKGDTWTEPTTGMEFVYVKGGCFQMGSNKGDSDEKPVHKVCVDGFWLCKYEVTNGQFRHFRSNHDSKEYKSKSLNNNDQPVVYVSWEDARDYASWLAGTSGKSVRLPTEAEWEYAARAGTNTIRFWGNAADDASKYANVHDLTSKRVNTDFTWEHHNCDDGYAVTASVGSFQANSFGLYDMLGNVWEWCSDWYGDDYYSSSSRNNPQGASSASIRVFRGGGWSSNSRSARSADRGWYAPGIRLDYLGFRLAFVEGSR